MQPLRHSADLLRRYPAVLCDIWGVVHNGMNVFPDAVAALTEYRRAGGSVVLITNSPRPSDGVRIQLDEIGAPAECYDSVVTSGDTIRTLLRARPGARVFHLGPERDRSIADGLDLGLVGFDDAECVLCSGLFDDEAETPDDYTGLLGRMKQRGLDMFCANPDRVVHRGERLVFCAGALAERYSGMSGVVLTAGKPFAPIYGLALDRFEEHWGRRPGAAEVIAIGDGVPTDITGAAGAGLDTLFITGGIHGLEMGSALDTPEPEALDRFIAGILRDLPGLKLVGTQVRLCW